MTEFETIMQANSKPAKTRRKAPMEASERLFLDKVRDVKLSLLSGADTLVVLDTMKSFEEVFLHYTPAMKLYARDKNLFIKTVDQVTAEDLECNIIEMDEE